MPALGARLLECCRPPCEPRSATPSQGHQNLTGSSLEGHRNLTARHIGGACTRPVRTRLCVRCPDRTPPAMRSVSHPQPGTDPLRGPLAPLVRARGERAGRPPKRRSAPLPAADAAPTTESSQHRTRRLQRPTGRATSVRRGGWSDMNRRIATGCGVAAAGLATLARSPNPVRSSPSPWHQLLQDQETTSSLAHLSATSRESTRS